MSSSKKPPTSRIGRMSRLSGLSGRVSGSYLGQRIKGAFQDEDTRKKALRKLHLENAERVVDTMSTLKGAAMKIGQYASVAAEGLDLPPEVGRVFRKLTHEAKPIPFETIKEDIEASLEKPLDELFQRFDPEPLGTASLGQAHAAWLPDGTAVVVKVLHRGIDKAVDSDLKALKTMLVAGGFVKSRKEDLDIVFEEIKARLEEELDYYQEAANLEFFHAAFKDDPDITVPATYPSHCTERVLTMDRMVGLPLEAFNDQASVEARTRAGKALVRCFHTMFYDLRALQADPHAGNYLIDKHGHVGLLDFGCVRRFDTFFVGTYAKMAIAGFEQRKDVAVTCLEDLGVIRPGAPPAAQDALWSVVDHIAWPFRQGQFQAGGPDDNLIEQIKRDSMEVVKHPDILAIPEFVFLDRALAGNYLMLRTLKLETDYGSLVRPYFERAIEVAEGRVAG